MKELKELFEEIFKEIDNELENKSSDRPSDKDVLNMFKEENLKSFDKIDPIILHNNCIDINNHLILAKIVKLGSANLTKEELQKFSSNIYKLKNWIDNILTDAVNIVNKKIKDFSYNNMSKEELIEELKKYKKE